MGLKGGDGFVDLGYGFLHLKEQGGEVVGGGWGGMARW